MRDYKVTGVQTCALLFQAEDGIRDYKVTGVQTCALSFQAEDGIRDYKVTGVQTCALPISGPQYSRDLTNRCFITRIGRRVTIMSEADMFDHRDSHDHVETSLGEGQSHRIPAQDRKSVV